MSAQVDGSGMVAMDGGENVRLSIRKEPLPPVLNVTEVKGVAS
jgi:hypothetical protein